MTKRNLCEECSAIENPDGFANKCLFCGEKIVGDIVCALCRAEMSCFMQSKGFSFPENPPTTDQLPELKAMDAEIEQHMKQWLARRKWN